MTSVLDKEDTSSRVMMRFVATHQPELEVVLMRILDL
jgi:hypothetical protein